MPTFVTFYAYAFDGAPSSPTRGWFSAPGIAHLVSTRARTALGRAADEHLKIFRCHGTIEGVNFDQFMERVAQGGFFPLAEVSEGSLVFDGAEIKASVIGAAARLESARGWDKKLTPSLQTTAKYDERGVMGSGKWYGVPNYGEYVTVYYNKDMFKKHGVTVPTTLDEMTAAMDTFVSKKITPLGMSGAEYPAGQLFYQLALSKADRSFVDNYQLYQQPVNFEADPLKYGATTFADWVKKGYVSKESASLKAEDMGVAFISGKVPMIVSGSWWYGRFATDIKFDWDTFLFPGNTLQAGSSGNLWVVPTSSKAKDLAADFIDITMRPEIQNLLGNSGGVPVAADPSKITDPKNQKLITDFNTVNQADGLAFYPDWPVPGYYDVLVSGFQGLINGSKTPDQVLTSIAKPYEEGVDEIKNS